MRSLPLDQAQKLQTINEKKFIFDPFFIFDPPSSPSFETGMKRRVMLDKPLIIFSEASRRFMLNFLAYARVKSRKICKFISGPAISGEN